MVVLPLEQRQRRQQQRLEVVGLALVDVEPVVPGHRPREGLTGLIPLRGCTLGGGLTIAAARRESSMNSVAARSTSSRTSSRSGRVKLSAR